MYTLNQIKTPTDITQTEDNRIKSEIQNSFVFKNILRHEPPMVSCRKGHVKLSGMVKHYPQLFLAAEAARATANVRPVQCNLIPEPIIQSNAHDHHLMGKIKMMLKINADIQSEICVAVRHGNVSLRGRAHSHQEAQLIGQVIQRVFGVYSISNQLKVHQNGEQKNVSTFVDDASITAQIKMAFVLNRISQIIKTEVRTVDGIVSIIGTAKSHSEKELVAQLASEVHGVKKIQNELTVIEAA